MIVGRQLINYGYNRDSMPEVRKELDDRIHDCLKCGLVMDRDHNAAINILNLGLGQTSAEKVSLLVQHKKRISKYGSVKQEATGL
jgi:transposase